MKILKLWSIFMAILFQSAMPADAKVGGIFDAKLKPNPAIYFTAPVYFCYPQPLKLAPFYCDSFPLLVPISEMMSAC